ncbi:MAG: hypothetical protein CVU09_16340 [Bacteroidetes bacterium HGW-Bacteroidetes-4]|jgi:hypothetical protein|nr:MAG: hypothetical protein CVU09_16340 [Bacteroidetes bacterium HGW-Bacteroidetes-4]
METNKNLNPEIEKTLASLNNIQKTKADPFFYTRLTAKLEREQEPRVWHWFFDIPILRPALMLLFAVINLFTLMNWMQPKTENNSISSTTEQFIEEYELNETNYTLLVYNEE